MATERGYTANEMMVCQAARQLSDGDVVFVGIGLPNLASNLARKLHAPKIVLLYESGAVGATPERLPVSIGDPALVTDSLSVCSMFDIFNCYLQGGRIDVGFLQGAQIDRHGNLNTTVVGPYEKPTVRLPGSGGACEIAILAKKVFVVMPQTKRSFLERVDFVTSPGFLNGGNQRRDLGMSGGGPSMVITDLGVYGFDNGELILNSVHPGSTVDDVQANLAFKVKVAGNLKATEPPTKEELRIIREELDPKQHYL